MNNSNLVIYTRRENGQGWTRGRGYHQTALQQFWEVQNLNHPDPIRIEFPHPDGGMFVGHFRRIGEDEGDNFHCEYINESGQRVELMLCNPSYAARINRLVDY